MAGDLNIDEWIGDVYSEQVTTGFHPARFENTSKKLRVLQIRNTSPTYHAWIGKYTSSGGAFDGNAYLVNAGCMLWLEYVDLYDLGHHFYASGYSILYLIGTC